MALRGGESEGKVLKKIIGGLCIMQVLSQVCAVDLSGRVFCWVSIFEIGLGVGEWLNGLGHPPLTILFVITTCLATVLCHTLRG